MDKQFRAVPVPTLVGIPLLWKALPGTGGDDSHIRSNLIVRFMADPDDGFAPMEWQYGGNRGPAPPVVLARRDKLPFSSEEWAILDEYISDWIGELSEAEEDRIAVSRRWLTPEAFKAHLQAECETRPTAFLSVRFPIGSVVVAEGLSVAELNGREGEVVQFGRDRVGVRYPDRGPIALRPERLRLLRAPPPPAAEPEPQPDGGAAKRRRQEDLEKQEALAISKRFVECLHEDTFPEMGELHLFGVGTEYHSRAQEVLAVWQGAAKHGSLTAEQLADALVQGTMKDFFEQTCRELAQTRTPNSPYAVQLITNNFAAVEWDTL